MVLKKMYTLILASKSPRRRELLGYLKLPFIVKSKKIDETSSCNTHRDIVEDIARKKGVAVYDEYCQRKDLGDNFFPLIVGSDTIVTLGDMVLGKPNDISHARSMLQMLSGKIHSVFTGVYLGRTDIESGEYKEIMFSVETNVEFTSISDDLLENYLATNDSLDKAGAYGIQGEAGIFISNISGSYSNVVGFPLVEFVDQLKRFIGDSEDFSGSWRNLFCRT